MPDTYTTTTKTSWGSRIGSSIKGIFLGIILFFASFFLLFWNEGRFDLSILAKEAIPISSTELETSQTLQGSLVSTSGTLSTTETLSDGLYVENLPAMALERVVEVYAWTESSSSTTESNLGGSETTETTYTYSKKWVTQVPDSASFAEPEGHQNVPKSLESQSTLAQSATIGVYAVDLETLSLPGYQQLVLSEENVSLPEDSFDELVGSQYIYSGVGLATSPEIGDMRVSYKYLPATLEQMTVFGGLQQSSLVPYTDQKGNRLYRAFSVNADGAVNQLHQEHTTSTWLFRLLGFIMMWSGLGMIFRPISVLMDIIPIFGTVSRSMLGVITGIVAFVLSLVTIIVSILLHSIVFVILIVGALIAGGVYWFIRHKGLIKQSA